MVTTFTLLESSLSLSLKQVLKNPLVTCERVNIYISSERSALVFCESLLSFGPDREPTSLPPLSPTLSPPSSGQTR